MRTMNRALDHAFRVAALAAILAVVAGPAVGQAPAPTTTTQTLTPQQAVNQMEKHLLSYNRAEARNVREKVSGAPTAALMVATGRLLMQERKLAEAEAELKKAVAAAPADPAPHLWLGESYLLARDAPRSTEAFRKAADLARARLTAAPDNYEALFQLGVAQQRLRQFPEAVATLQKARTLKPSDPLVLYQLGATRAFQQLWSESVDLLTQTINLDPGIAYAYYYRGMSASRIGRKDLLINDLNRFLTLAPDAPEAASAKKILEAAR